MSLHAHVFLQRTPGSRPEPIGQLEVEPLPPGTRATNSARDERGGPAPPAAWGKIVSWEKTPPPCEPLHASPDR
jgi:hypothetical protein